MLNICLTAKENSVKYLPEKPKAGDEITIYYNQANTILSDVKNIEIVFSLYSSKSFEYQHIEETHNHAMTKQGETWTYKIKTTSNTDCIAIKFCDGSDYDFFDNNDGLGYFVRIYDNTGNETNASALGYATAFNSWATLLQFVNRDQNKSLEIMNKVFKDHPELKAKYPSDYLTILNKFTPDKDKPELLKKELAVFEKNDELSDHDYNYLIWQYENLKMPEKAAELKRRAISKYPKGEVAISNRYKDFEAEKDINKQKELAIKYHEYFKEMGRYQASPFGYKLLKFAEVKDSVNLRKWWDFIKDKNWAGVESYGFYPGKLVEYQFGLDVALEICEKGEKLWNDEKAVASMPVLHWIPEYQINWTNGRDQANLYFAHAKALILLNRKEEAPSMYAKAFSLYPVPYLRFIEKDIKDCINFLIELKKYETAKPVIEEALRLGIMMDGMKDGLKAVYLKQNGTENGFDDYYNNIIATAKKVFVEKQKKQMVNQPAPQFTLIDLDGKKVSLADLKGKVVVIDFWATWCGPCKMSFPAMQKTIDKFKDNKDVVFLFVNTWQTETDKKKNAEDFIKENKYAFHVLLDNENKVVADFKVGGIPTKFVIDKSGNIRFNIVGAETGDTAVESLSSMIDLAGK